MALRLTRAPLCDPAQIQERLTDGTGDFDPEALLKKLPEDLALPEKKVSNQLRNLAKDRRRTTLVQVHAPLTRYGM